MCIIYLARNIINGMGYVGQSINSLKYKKREKKGYANNGDLQLFPQALREFGFENFEWTVLYQDDDNDPDWMDFLERKYIKKCNTLTPNGYNMTRGGRGLSGYSHTEESRSKVGAAQKGKVVSEETRAKMSAVRKNCKRNPTSEETKAKISQAQKGRKFTEEHKRKLSEAAKKRDPATRKASEETRENRRASALKQWETRPRVQTEETKRKISEGLYRYYRQKES